MVYNALRRRSGAELEFRRVELVTRQVTCRKSNRLFDWRLAATSERARRRLTRARKRVARHRDDFVAVIQRDRHFRVEYFNAVHLLNQPNRRNTGATDRAHLHRRHVLR